MADTAPPNTARVTSLAHWTRFFHPDTGTFRLPSTLGHSVEHLEIDLRYVDHEFDEPPRHPDDNEFLPLPKEISLPNVCILTLRGGEFIQESEERMDALAEVLVSISPVEVRWLNAATDPAEQLTFSTHLVHPAIIAAGERWSRGGSLRKLVVQGGFPCPNLTAPTPFSLTPAATPCPSPGPAKTTFGSLSSATGLKSMPSLSTTKPKPVDPEKLRERAERKRMADYSLKPRFEYAFGALGPEEIRWRFDGRYTSACILATIKHLLQALADSYPSPSVHYDLDMPSLITFAPLVLSQELRDLPDSLDLAADLAAYIQDVVFFELKDTPGRFVRPWDGRDGESRERQARRFKAEMLLLQAPGASIVPQGETRNKEAPLDHRSPSGSFGSMTLGETDGSESEAVTPDLSGSLVVEPSETSQETRKALQATDQTWA